jgi:hypothetical protein
MKYVPDRQHGLAQRPHYEPAELDTTFEQIIIKFLKGKYGVARFPVPTEDLKTLIEKDVSDLEQYADLSRFGDGVEGVTLFDPGCKPKVYVVAELTEDDRRENRLRTTLTHEYGHVCLHAPLFAIEQPNLGLFDSGAKQRGIYCKRETMIQARQADWMEWQAGYACGAILMPATYVRRTAGEIHERLGIFGAVSAETPAGATLINSVVDGYQVSREAARVRLSVLGLLGQAPTAKYLFS